MLRFPAPLRPLHRGFLLALLLGAALVPASPAVARESAPEWRPGPMNADLGKEAQVAVPEGFLFLDAEGTRSLMQRMGNPPSDQEVGLVTPASDEETWFVVFEYYPVGYVRDDDRGEIEAEAILEGISEGTEAANEIRREQGFAPLHVVGWFEEPHYDAASHNLVWALEAREETGRATGEEDRIINHNIRLLGRHGYMSATLVTDPALVARHKVEAERLLQGFSYKPGKRYAEFVSGDKLAGYGLTALIAGGAGAAAAKLGLFAKLAKVLARMWKLVVVGILAIGAALKRFAAGLFGRRAPTDAEVG